MCGRYVRRSDKQKIAEYFHAKPSARRAAATGRGLQHRTDNLPADHPAKRGLVLARWGLVPFFTKELSEIKGLSTITARAESIIKAPTWREPMKKRRCIVPADAFFEWRKVDKPPKQPYAFELANGHPIGFAGLWDAWKDKDGHWLQSFAIVTTEANELMAPIRPRMPVILHARDYYRWLDREETERLPLDLLRPLESEEMEMFEANPRVGNVRNNGPQLMRAAAKSAKHGELPLGRRDGKSNPEHGSLPLQADAAANRDPAAMGSLRAL